MPEEFKIIDLKLSTTQEAELSTKLQEMLEKSKMERAPYEKAWENWEKQYAARRNRIGEATEISQLDYPTTREFCRQIISRILNPIFQHDPIFVAKARKPDLQDAAMIYEQVMDFITDKSEFMRFCDEFLTQALIYPTAFAKTSWTDTTRTIKMRTEGVETTEMGFEYVEKIEEQTIPDKVGCFPEVRPCKDIFLSVGASDLQSCECVFDRLWFTEHDIKKRIRNKVYKSDALDMLGQKRSKYEDEAWSSHGSQLNTADDEFYEVYEAYLEYEVKKNVFREVIITFENESGKILRAIENPFFEYQRPFVCWSYERIHGKVYGNSLCYQLEPLHRAYTASVNQRLDNASLANTTLLVGRMGNQLGRHFRKGRVKGGYYEIAGDPGADVKQFNISQNYSQLPELEGRLLQHMSNISAIQDYNRGVEQINRPTATGQTQLIQEGQQPLFMLLESFRDTLSLLVQHQMSRYRQFYPDGLEVYLQTEGGQGQSVIEQFVQWPELMVHEVLIETKVSSQTMNKMMRRQEKLSMVDKIPQIYQTMMQFLQTASQPNPLQHSALLMIQAYQIIIKDFLEEFDIPDEEELNPDFTQALAVDQQIMQMLQQMQQQIDQLSSQNQQLTGQLDQVGQELSQLFGGGSGGPGESPQGAQAPGGPPPQAPG